MKFSKFTQIILIIININLIYFANYGAAEETPEKSKSITKQIDDILYFISQDDRLDWKGALKYCIDKNMQLVSFENKDKLDKLNAFLQNEGWVDTPDIAVDYIFWTSGNDLKQENNFVWESIGEKLTFPNWLPGQPDNWRGDENCIEMGFRELGKWNDNRCKYRRHFICERKFDETHVVAV